MTDDTSLDSHTARFLLLGPLAMRRKDMDTIGAFYKRGPAAWADAWGRHEKQLRSYAKEHSIRPIKSKVFFAEGVAAFERRHRR